jgi:hypothetical protein
MKPTGAVREELVDELLEKERSIAKARDEIKTKTKLLREKVKALEDRRLELLDLLEGKEHIQPNLPLTTPKTDRRGAGLSIALADNGVPVPPGEVKAAKEELDRKRRAREAEIDGDEAAAIVRKVDEALEGLAS